MRASHRLIFVLSVALVVSSCSRFTSKNDDKVIAKVNGQPILLNDFMVNYRQLKSQYDEISQKNPRIVDQLKSRALNEVIIGTVLRQEASKVQISIAKEEIEGRLANWKDGYPVGGFEEMLKKRNTTENFLKRRIEHLLLIEKLTSELFASETLISDEEIKSYHKKHNSDFTRPSRVHVYQIVVNTVEEAKKIRQEILSKNLTFESAARQFSLTPDASKGGDLGFFAKDEKGPVFNKAFSLQIGSISQPVQSKYGFHLFKVVEKHLAKKLKYIEAKPEIVDTLRKQKEVRIYKEWVTNLLKEGKIFKNETLFNSIT